MHVELLREYCLSKKEVEETFPFDANTLVFKVAGKMFCLIGLDNPSSCNLKCIPEKSIELRQEYQAIEPGFHMDKNHWNTVTFNLDVNDKLILELIDLSYELVIKGLTKKIRLEKGL
ncbi:MAG: MmcQ-like protein [Bacteroidetes bacterium B1(2017)]|nr:MAG: MmcQ-like protein [Bacteroidetes bacterium B1(2017)]